MTFWASPAAAEHAAEAGLTGADAPEVFRLSSDGPGDAAGPYELLFTHRLDRLKE